LRRINEGLVFGPSWNDLLEGYTERKMTFSTDRLGAMEGLINAISRLSGYRCVHGHWEPYVVESLSWYCVEDELTLSLNGSPSWSWASVNGQVYFTQFGYFTAESPWAPEGRLVAKVRSISCTGDVLELESLMISTEDLRDVTERMGVRLCYPEDRPKLCPRKRPSGRIAFLLRDEVSRAVFLKLEALDTP
jgi:hypothetical protein